jgi:phenylalanyl-tRNA synthetase beta chain
MRVPIEWLREFVRFPMSTGELAQKLTMIGLEVESIEEMHDDTVFEVNVTPNRPDCLSILGIAREVSALMHIPLKFPDYRIEKETGECEVSVEVPDEDLCHRYAGRCIKGVVIQESPEWMKRRLEKCGMRPINAVVDITNYVLLEMGQPLHAFDMDLLRGKKIRAARSTPGSKLKTLDGVDRDLPEGSLLIWDAERPVAVAGVMGGSETEVTEKTRNVFIESAYFTPSSIRRTSKSLGLKTESSYRFERGIDIELLERALDRAASLMSGLSGGKVSKKVDVYPRPFRASHIRVRHGRVNKILGTSIPDDEMARLVKSLGVTVEDEAAGSFIAIPPPHRNDLQQEIDIIEEIARFYGYDRIPVTVPKMGLSKEAWDRRRHRISTVTGYLRAAGFTEVINYSFMNYQMLDLLGIREDDPRRKTLSVRNPINEGESCLRTTLVPSLIQNLLHNVSMGTRNIRLFEVSRVFRERGETLPEERHALGGVYFIEKSPALWKEDTPDFYRVKGVIESLLDELRIKDVSFLPSSEPFLHPGKCCNIIVSGEKVGFLGVLHPAVIEKLSLKVSRPEILLLEIDLDRLLLSATENVSYAPIAKYPYIDRDVALIVDESVSAATIIEKVRAYSSDLIEEVSIFDFYKGKNIPEGKKSLAFTVRYRAADRTLTDAEIEELHRAIVNSVTEKTGGTVRGA